MTFGLSPALPAGAGAEAAKAELECCCAARVESTGVEEGLGDTMSMAADDDCSTLYSETGREGE